MAKDDFVHESIQDNTHIADYLQALIEGFRQGHLKFNAESQEIDMYPDDLVELSVKAKRRGERNKITLKFEWKETRKTPSNEFRIIS